MKKLWILSLLLVALSCKKTIDNNAENPFAGQETVDTTATKLELTTIEGLHKNVFAVRCANPTCHDGSFEPDFRTVQSTYSSLVYHPVTKNDAANSFTYRVQPGDADGSWIVHRVTTDDEVLGRMPLYAQPLSADEINGLKSWINAGAKDMFGNEPSQPNLAPSVYGYQIYNTANQRVDTIRTNGWASEVMLEANTTYNMVFYVEDDHTPTADLQNQKIEFSLERDNFQPFASISLTKLYEKVTTGTLNTGNFATGTIIYFRYSLEDDEGAHTQFPADQSEYWWKQNFSFIIQ